MVYLFSSVYDDVTLLRQFLEHYVTLGVERIVLNINTYRDSQLVSKVRDCGDGYPVSVAFVYGEPQTWRIQNSLRNRAQDLYMNSDDWALIADLDEFQEYPVQLTSLLVSRDARDEQCVYGTLLDRVATSGELPALRDDLPVETQFPVVVSLTHDVLKAPTEKVVAVKGAVRPSGSCVAPEVLRRDFGARTAAIRAQIHHYKWHSGVVAKLRERTELYKSAFLEGDQAFRNYEESERFLRYYEATGRIRIEDFAP